MNIRVHDLNDVRIISLAFEEDPHTHCDVRDFKGLIQNDRVVKIGVNLFRENAYFLAPLYKLMKKDVNTLMREIGKFIQNKRVQEYAEEAFNSVSDQIILKPLFYSKEMCLEIDTINDLHLARNLIENRSI